MHTGTVPVCPTCGDTVAACEGYYALGPSGPVAGEWVPFDGFGKRLLSSWHCRAGKGMGSDAAAIMLAAVRAQVHALHGVSVPEEPTGSAATIDAGAFVAAVQRALGHPLMTRP